MKYLKYSALTVISLFILTFAFISLHSPKMLEHFSRIPLTATVLGITDPSDNHTGHGEACDGTDVNGYTCATVAAGFKSGTLTCNADRKSYNTSQCVVGNTIPATSCSQTDVQNAIDLAEDGDIVVVPAGNCTYTTKTQYAAAVLIDKAIILKGAGIGQTVITDATNNGFIETAIRIIGGPARITGFTFNGDSGSQGTVHIRNAPMNWRIDNCSFEGIGARAIKPEGYSYGVIDTCSFEVPAHAVSLFGDGDDAWLRNLTLGTANAVYIEDNNFTTPDCSQPEDSCIDAYGGARYVFRYNNVSCTSIGHHGLDSGGYRSPHSWEIYGNLMDGEYGAGVDMAWPFRSRGGTGVLFNNTYTNYGRGPILSSYRSCNAYAPWGMCNGTNPIDGNLEENGYPCMDQNGRSTDSDFDGAQDLEPIYQWNDTLGGDNVNISFNPSSCVEEQVHIQENRDYYNDTVRPGYVPYPYPHPLTLIDPTPTTTYTLNITTENGTVSKNPDKATYVAGEQVILEAINNPGYTFTGWSGALSGSTNPVTITIGD